jgi:hypothetical protein
MCIPIARPIPLLAPVTAATRDLTDIFEMSCSMLSSLSNVPSNVNGLIDVENVTGWPLFHRIAPPNVTKQEPSSNFPDIGH